MTEEILRDFGEFLAGRLDAGPTKFVMAGETRSLENLEKAAIPVVIGSPSSFERSHIERAMNRHPLLVIRGDESDQSQPLQGFIARLVHAGAKASLVGRMPNGSNVGVPLAIVENPGAPLTVPEPSGSVRVTALMTVFNEADILAASIRDLVSQGAEAYVVDNWSTDGSFEIAQSLVGEGVIGVERYPIDGPPTFFDLPGLMTRFEELLPRLGDGWYIKHDVDEARRSPWPDLPLAQALSRVERAGFNRADFTVANFVPIDDGFRPGDDFVSHFRRFEWGRNSGHFVQHKAWKYWGQPVSIAAKLSHRIEFEGARTFPVKFLLKHYPIRSQAHGEMKIFRYRKPRIDPAARALGRHKHYDAFESGTSFLADPDETLVFDDEFHIRYFVERLSGVGIPRR